MSGLVVFTRARRAIVVPIALGGAAMLLYPGGTALDRSTRGYSLAQNFLSDLGMTVGYDGRSNVAGALCFAAALGVLVLGLGGALVGFVRGYAAVPRARPLAYASAGVGLLVCLAFVGVALTPEDRAMTLHVGATRLAFWLFPVATLLLTLAAHASGAARRAVAMWGALSVVLTAYAGLLAWGPALGTPAGLRTYVVAQKLVTVAVLLAALRLTAVLPAEAPAGPPNVSPPM